MGVLCSSSASRNGSVQSGDCTPSTQMAQDVPPKAFRYAKRCAHMRANSYTDFWNEYPRARIVTKTCLGIVGLFFVDAIRSLYLVTTIVDPVHPAKPDELNLRTFAAQRNAFLTGFILFIFFLLHRFESMLADVILLEKRVMHIHTRYEYPFAGGNCRDCAVTLVSFTIFIQQDKEIQAILKERGQIDYDERPIHPMQQEILQE